MEMLSEDDRNLKGMTRAELEAAWDLWFDLAQETNPSDPPYSHGVFAGMRAEDVQPGRWDDAPHGTNALSREARIAAGLLARVMSDISEDVWCAGWLTEVEYILWDAIARERPDWCVREEIEQLKFLSERCGGWIVWDKERGRRFVRMEDWLDRYARWRSKREEETARK